MKILDTFGEPILINDEMKRELSSKREYKERMKRTKDIREWRIKAYTSLLRVESGREGETKKEKKDWKYWKLMSWRSFLILLFFIGSCFLSMAVYWIL